MIEPIAAGRPICMVNIEDIEVLAMAAGGYGVPDSKRLGNFWRTTGTVQ